MKQIKWCDEESPRDDRRKMKILAREICGKMAGKRNEGGPEARWKWKEQREGKKGITKDRINTVRQEGKKEARKEETVKREVREISNRFVSVPLILLSQQCSSNTHTQTHTHFNRLMRNYTSSSSFLLPSNGPPVLSEAAFAPSVRLQWGRLLHPHTYMTLHEMFTVFSSRSGRVKPSSFLCSSPLTQAE